MHAISSGPIKSRVAGGLKDFDLLLNEAVEQSPVHDLVDIDDVGMATACLATPHAKKLTGITFYIDAGLSIMC